MRFAGFTAIGISTMILIAACANLANMLLARGAQRKSELAVRRAIGASSARVLRLLLAETAIIAVLAASAGLAIAIGTLRTFDAPQRGSAFFARRRGPLSELSRLCLRVRCGALATIVVGIGTHGGPAACRRCRGRVGGRADRHDRARRPVASGARRGAGHGRVSS